MLFALKGAELLPLLLKSYAERSVEGYESSPSGVSRSFLIKVVSMLDNLVEIGALDSSSL